MEEAHVLQTSEAQPPISMRPVIFAVAFTGIVLAWVSEFAFAEFQASVFALLVLTLAGSAWLVSEKYPEAGRWLTVVGTVALILLASGWMRNPVSLVLLAIPTTMAITMIGSPAAAATALAETALLFPLLRYLGLSADPFNVGFVLIAIWGTPGLVWAAYRRLRKRAAWLSDYYQTCHRALEEARDHKAELDQLREDWTNAVRQLALANERLAALRLVAEEARKSKAAFVARVSHEFRTPLNIIIGMVSLIIEAPEVYGGGLPPRALEHLRTVYDNCQHLAGLIGDVLDLSQVEAGRVTLHRDYVDLAGVIDEAVAVVRPLIDQKGLTLRVGVPEGLPRVYCDRTRVRQIMLNLLSNAARLTEEGGIGITVERRDRHVTVAVSDTGPGIAPEDAERIFEPFRQGTSPTWRAKEGSGLGLSISKELVQLHGGQMRFESEVGRGTTFFVELPLSGPVGHIVRPEGWIKPDWVWLEEAFRTNAADLADSNSRLRVVVCDQAGGLVPELARYSGEIQFINTQDLTESVQESQRCPAHFVVLNTVSPGSLLPLIEAARREVPDTPIIGCCCPAPAAHAVQAGALDYLTKPVLCADLTRVIEEVGTPVERVLIVDDEASARELLASYVHAYDPTIDVLEASSGAQALDGLRERRPDLMLLDLVMPDVDGWQVLAAKSGDEAIRDIPVVIVSAKDAREEPARSPLLVVTMGQGLSLSKLLECSRHLSTLLLQPD